LIGNKGSGAHDVAVFVNGRISDGKDKSGEASCLPLAIEAANARKDLKREAPRDDGGQGYSISGSDRP
jgi:hypothetical protein